MESVVGLLDVSGSIGHLGCVSGSAGPTGLQCPTVPLMPFGQALDKGDYEFLGPLTHGRV